MDARGGEAEGVEGEEGGGRAVGGGSGEAEAREEDVDGD